MSAPRFRLEDLEVQTFETTSAAHRRPGATVRGQTEMPYEETGEMDPACNPNYTQTSSCQNNGVTCDGCEDTVYSTPETCHSTGECLQSDDGSPCGTGHCGSTSVCTGNTCTCNWCTFKCEPPPQ